MAFTPRLFAVCACAAAMSGAIGYWLGDKPSEPVRMTAPQPCALIIPKRWVVEVREGDQVISGHEAYNVLKLKESCGC